ncbi:MAG: hypothetical protein EZS28_000143 [Streblomastix strix]|uniref:Transposase Tc1-like domain-containing protein n=1 Tax=Streblomastix strix TaxID=222440 RepID=A0A5J4XCS4_9EUKA|nr:MAG: hypothetical protein EZS28_000143 [Streblomastix strix]
MYDMFHQRSKGVKPKNRGSRKKITEKIQRKITNYARRHRRSGHRSIASGAKIDVSPTSTQQVLHDNGFISIKLRRRPLLIHSHIQARIDFMTEYLVDISIVNTSIAFSDEKKFRYDSLDGWSVYQAHILDNPGAVHFSKDCGKYKEVIVHIVISSAGVLSVARVVRIMNAELWRDLLADEVQPEIHAAHSIESVSLWRIMHK